MLGAGAKSLSPAAKDHDWICILGRKLWNERNRIQKFMYFKNLEENHIFLQDETYLTIILGFFAVIK